MFSMPDASVDDMTDPCSIRGFTRNGKNSKDKFGNV